MRSPETCLGPTYPTIPHIRAPAHRQDSGSRAVRVPAAAVSRAPRLSGHGHQFPGAFASRSWASAMKRTTGSVPDGRTWSQAPSSGQARRSPSAGRPPAPGGPPAAPRTRQPPAPGEGRLLLHDVVFRPSRGGLGQGPPVSTRCWRRRATPTGASRVRWRAGRMIPPFPSPPTTAPSSCMRRATLISPTGARWQRGAVGGATSSTTRLVERFVTTGPRPAEAPRLRRVQGSGPPPAGDRYVHQRQPVHVGIHGEPHLRPRGPDQVPQIPRFAAVGSGSRGKRPSGSRPIP
jgi:hypothetical protein